jgi:hypothetical protein
MKVYKVVRESWAEPGKYYSALVDGLALMTYRIGAPAEVPDWLAHQGYHATAFDTLGNAELFAQAAGRDLQIFEAEGDAVALPNRAAIFDVIRGRLDSPVGDDWPAGTVMVKSLKLIGSPR